MTTPSTPALLQPLSFPLHGSRLIEASAGTGKTFTIAMLYVRLVLGHGQEAAFERPLTPPDILVVTFTEAATQELRDRIRARLAEAARCFRVAPQEVQERAPGADLLHDLRAEYPVEQWPLCAHRLQLAAEWMDEAAVSTIHGWCHRMLREHAFDSNSLFQQTLEADDRELLAQAVRDYWRTFLAPLDDAMAGTVAAWWSGPQALLTQLRPLLAHATALPDSQAPDHALRQAAQQRDAVLAKLKQPWPVWADELQALLDAGVERKQVDGRKVQERYYGPRLQALRAWAATAEMTEPALNAAGWGFFSPTGWSAAWKGQAPSHPAIDAWGELQAALAQLPRARDAVLAHAARWVAARQAQQQARRAQMGFNDLLTRLDGALQGANGERLAQTIRQQFPVALIDEFQDTDPVQYRIFDAVYRVAQPWPGSALVLIGDPKQAIYAFRGADIHTYLRARQDCGERLYTLRRNFRSTQAMVAAANHWFEQAEARTHGAGAFLFRNEQGNPVPFWPAEAQGRDESFVIDGAVAAALTVWYAAAEAGTASSKAPSKEAYLDHLAHATATEMVRLLQGAQQGRVGFAGQQGMRALRPADLAVLVNNRQEADAIRRALARRGVRSVYLSERESVYGSPQAEELLRWLLACAEPDDPRRLRAALATRHVGLSWAELDRLQHDEQAWESRVLQFRGYRDIWRRQGVLPLLRHWLHDFDIAARLLSGTGVDDNGRSGERVLTDLLHLAELLQQASTQLDGEHAVIRYLAEQRRQAQAGAQGDAPQLRLESDADLVQVITIHKSKGLEYPLVFLPFIAAFRPVKPDDLPLQWHDEQGRLQLALSGDEAAAQRADHERLGEDLRKLYVALTRARHATWMGLAPLADWGRSAVGYLVSGGAPMGADDYLARLQTLAQSGMGWHVQAVPAATDTALAPEAEAQATGAARVSLPVWRDPWWVASYSALSTHGSATATAAPTPVPPISVTDSAREDVFLETPAPDEQAVAAMAAGGTDLHAFVRGKEAGTLLHDLLEWSAREGFAAVAGQPQRLRDQVARRCALRGWAHWVEPLTQALLAWLQAPVPLQALGESVPLRLADLTTAVPEMEFWLAVHHVDVTQMDAWVSQHTLGAAARPALQPTQLNGMLKGFMDLVFEHNGRYYVADYKSNWLGPDASAYTAQAMRAEVLRSRYELQYTLYLLALHRLLRARLADYDYERHIGGAVYLFLRGLDADSRGVHLERPPHVLIDALDRLFAQSAVAAEVP